MSTRTDDIFIPAKYTPSTLVRVAVGGAISFVIMFLLEMPLPGFPVFLRYDPSAVPALFAGITLGTSHGIAVVVIKDILFLFTGKSSGGLLGVAADFTFVAASVWATAFVFWALQHRLRRLGWVLTLGLVVGTIAGTVLMSLANYYVFLPIWGVSQTELLPMVIGAIVPFNLVKGALNGILTALLLRTPLAELLLRRG